MILILDSILQKSIVQHFMKPPEWYNRTYPFIWHPLKGISLSATIFMVIDSIFLVSEPAKNTTPIPAIFAAQNAATFAGKNSWCQKHRLIWLYSWLDFSLLWFIQIVFGTMLLSKYLKLAKNKNLYTFYFKEFENYF